MKRLNFCFAAFCILITSSLSAQVPRRIVEDDLAKSFKKINNWYQQRDKDTTGAWGDSLQSANDVFGKKLQYYTNKYLPTIYSLNNLEPLGVDINTSADEMFRIYSWDTWTGGTMHYFENVMQYKVGNRTYSILDTASAESQNYVFPYYKLHTLKVDNHNYYLAIYYGVFSGKDRGQGIRIFTINQGKLEDAKLIKTQSGLHNKLYYDFDGFTGNSKVNENILYNEATRTISLPVVLDNGKLTAKRILYKFTGQYFERIKI